MSLPDLINPFVGLRSFESNEGHLFFGREQQTLELLQKLHNFRFVAIIGNSGSGKSSLIKAGLIPALEAGYLVDNFDRWLILSMKPGFDPLFNLANSLSRLAEDVLGDLNPAETIKAIQNNGVDAVLDILKPLIEQNNNIFFLVDQFEELFRFSLDEKMTKKKDEAIEFVNIIIGLSRRKVLPIYVVITMRSDFIGDCSQFFGLPEAMNESQFLVPKLKRSQLETAIQGPIGLYNVRINPGLTARLLNDSQIVKDELPLLQHVLMRTWDQEMQESKNGELDIDDYEKVGGIDKALSNHADEALKSMSEDDIY